jgi:hypothetical protein
MKNKLPSLGWCNILVSRLNSHDTRKAMGLESNHDLQETELYRSEAIGRVRRPRGRWLYYDANFGKYVQHPLEIPNAFSRVLWAHRDPWPAFLSAADRKKVPGAYGVVLRTKELAVLDILWAIKYVKQAVALDPEASKLTSILRGGTPTTLRRVRHYHDKLDLLAKLFPPPYLPTTFRIRTFCRLLLTRTFKVFYCNERGEVKDISSLDPYSKDEDVATWGNLNAVTSQAGDIVRTCVNRYLDR